MGFLLVKLYFHINFNEGGPGCWSEKLVLRRIILSADHELRPKNRNSLAGMLPRVTSATEYVNSAGVAAAFQRETSDKGRPGLERCLW